MTGGPGEAARSGGLEGMPNGAPSCTEVEHQGNGRPNSGARRMDPPSEDGSLGGGPGTEGPGEPGGDDGEARGVGK